MTRQRNAFATVFVLGHLAGLVASGQEWTRFRGPNGSGVSECTTIPVEWTADDYKWVSPLPGYGHSSPVVWGDRIFVTSADEDRAKRFVICIHADDGSELWRREVSFEKYKHHSNNSSASSTPAVDADYVYVLWQSRTSSPLVAFDHEGNEVWRYDLGPYLHGQGGGTSPIVFRDLVVVCNDHKSGSFLLAVDRKTGREVWKTPREGKRACYATPCVFDSGEREPELIFTHCFEGIVGVDPRTGTQNWMIDVFGKHPQRAVASPIIYGDLVVGSSGARAGEKNVVAVRPQGQGPDSTVREAYRITRTAPHVPTPILHDNLLFLWGDSGILSCVDAATGNVHWTNRVRGNYFGSPVCVDGNLYSVSLEGEVVVVKAADEFRLLARNPLGNPSRATPAVSDGTMFIRSYSRLYALGGM